MSTGLVSAPIAIGICGQRSRTSKTNGARFRRAAISPGTPIVSGVEVAKTTSARGSATAAAEAASIKPANESMRACMLM